MNNAITKEFSFWGLLKFTMPTAIMMLFLSLYSIVDGVFISRLVGTNALSAVNIVFPVITIVMAIGIMLGTGGSAIIARKMGEQKGEEARENFTLIVIIMLGISVIFGIVGLSFMTPIIRALGASEILLPYCQDYLEIILFFVPIYMLQILYQSFFVTAGKPNLVLVLTIGAGVLNGILDYIFMGPMNMGIKGAALGTISGCMLPAIVGTIYFFMNRESLYFVKPKLDLKMLIETCVNGSSEMVTNLASSVITFLFNIAMMKLLGEDGVAAITIVLYAQFLFTALYLGFCSGVAPIISYNYGSQNQTQLKRIFRMSLKCILGSSIVIFICSIFFAAPIVMIFTPKETATYGIALRGFMLFSLTYLFAGMNIFASSLFTALSNGKISAIISFLRTFVFIYFGILLFPKLLDVDGIWLAVPFAEVMTIMVSIYLINKKQKEYQY